MMAKYSFAYEKYFGMKIGDQDKSWAPRVICGTCRSNLEKWLSGRLKCMPFAVPRIWREPTNHVNDCFFCMTDLSAFKKTKNRANIIYPNIPSSLAPVCHSDDLPIPMPPSIEKESDSSPESANNDENYEPEKVLNYFVILKEII